MSSTKYFVGHSVAQRLRPLATTRGELEAIQRLEDFTGDEHDLRLAAAMLERAGAHVIAEELLLDQLSPT